MLERTKTIQVLFCGMVSLFNKFKNLPFLLQTPLMHNPLEETAKQQAWARGACLGKHCLKQDKNVDVQGLWLEEMQTRIRHKQVPVI